LRNVRAKVLQELTLPESPHSSPNKA